MNKITCLLLVLLVCVSCGKDPDISTDVLGGGTLFDPSLYAPEKYLVSYALPNPTPTQAQRPVIIACHGYTATTFEWDELRRWLESRGEEVYLSQVLLGGHGRSYEEFKKSTWKDWQKAITEEYTRLVQSGYTNISLLGSSTGGTLFLELLSSDYFNGKNVPKQVLLVDPIVIASNKSLSLAPVLGPVLGYVETEQTAAEDKVYYHYRPEETLRELQKLLNLVRKDLQEGIVLPPGCAMKMYKSKKDPSADPVSAVLIYKGVKTSSGQKIAVEMVDSELHVFTRLDLLNTTARDKQNQEAAFLDIINRVLGR